LACSIVYVSMGVHLNTDTLYSWLRSFNCCLYFYQPAVKNLARVQISACDVIIVIIDGLPILDVPCIIN